MQFYKQFICLLLEIYFLIIRHNSEVEETRWYAGWHSRTGRRGGRCEVGEAGELWDVVATMYTVFGRVMRLGHVI